MPYLKVDVVGGKQLRSRLENLARNAEEPREALQEVADDFLQLQQRRFARASAIWRPLKPESARRKARRGLSTEPLVGGRLEASLTIRGATYQVRRMNVRSITLGTRDPSAHLHQRGTSKKLPARPPVSLSPADERRWRDIFARSLTGALRRGL